MTSVSFRQLSRDRALRDRWLFKGEPIVLKIRSPEGKRLSGFLPRPFFSEAALAHPPKVDFRTFIGIGGKEKKEMTIRQQKKLIRDLWAKAALDGCS